MEKQKKTSKSRLLKIAVCLFVVYIAYSIVVQQLEIRDRKITLEAVQQTLAQAYEQLDALQNADQILQRYLEKSADDLDDETCRHHDKGALQETLPL